MDKSWIGKPHTSNEYLLGLDKFLDFVFKNAAVEDTIRCPCHMCCFGKWKTRDREEGLQAEIPCYGKLEDIIEINYNGRFKVVLFKCKWADTTRDRGYQKDRWNLNCVNFDKLIHTGEREEYEPYIEASQAQLVFYVDDIVNKGWSVAVHLKPRDMYDMGEVLEEEEVDENEPYQEQELEQFFADGDDYVQLATDHIINDIVDANVATNLATDAMSD
ncbi:hypothetical protein KY284_020350 [Solanum tuberosum]|nr:hypothetical protein KY284_020350 [Solanum tuberosum]